MFQVVSDQQVSLQVFKVVILQEYNDEFVLQL